eukprot:517004-Prorocentrum_minimum.AAC.1
MHAYRCQHSVPSLLVQVAYNSARAPSQLALVAPNAYIVLNCPRCSMAIFGPPDVAAMPCPACHTLVRLTQIRRSTVVVRHSDSLRLIDMP